MVTIETKTVLAIIISFGGTESREISAQRMAGLFEQHAGGRNVGVFIDA